MGGYLSSLLGSKEEDNDKKKDKKKEKSLIDKLVEKVTGSESKTAPSDEGLNEEKPWESKVFTDKIKQEKSNKEASEESKRRSKEDKEKQEKREDELLENQERPLSLAEELRKRNKKIKDVTKEEKWNY